MFLVVSLPQQRGLLPGAEMPYVFRQVFFLDEAFKMFVLFVPYVFRQVFS